MPGKVDVAGGGLGVPRKVRQTWTLLLLTLLRRPPSRCPRPTPHRCWAGRRTGSWGQAPGAYKHCVLALLRQAGGGSVGSRLNCCCRWRPLSTAARRRPRLGPGAAAPGPQGGQGSPRRCHLRWRRPGAGFAARAGAGAGARAGLWLLSGYWAARRVSLLLLTLHSGPRPWGKRR